ncbi:MAG: hypothetical protein K9J12_13510 [Melioribacteraceae bacterium]|nr:hypothetical protein [Melioribacteraceae bacterium]MCF8263887.1 hypothetical protein [Melioribacteraceae bacterium]
MDSLEKRFLEYFPNKFFLDDSDIAALSRYLKTKAWLLENETISLLEKPGEGNMNYVLRVRTNLQRSFILKQSRPWVEKYPQINAPSDRINVEAEYYNLANNSKKLSQYTPSLIDFDSENFIMAIEDLGETSDFSFIYQKGNAFSDSEISEIIAYLNELKKIDSDKPFPNNLEMRKLNHQHIFHLPFLINNGFDLDSIQPGLQSLSLLCKSDNLLKEKIAELGEIYLSPGKILVHGDYYPGSLLKTKDGVKVIDAEFGFFGPEEWDIAIFVAHLFMAQCETDLINFALVNFSKLDLFNDSIFAGFVGAEILRRLIGLAQLPLELSLEEKSVLIDRAISMIKNQKIEV